MKKQETVIPVNDMDLSISKVFSRITTGMDDLSKSFIGTAVKDYYRYSIRKIIEAEQQINQPDF